MKVTSRDGHKKEDRITYRCFELDHRQRAGGWPTLSLAS